MKIHHSPTAGDFTIIPNETLRDERLSFAARGHLAYLLSRPDDWRTNSDDEAERARRLRNKRGEGREAMRALYRELKDAGYLRLARSADASGHWTTETHVYDRPFTEVRPTDVPESRTSVRPAETESSQVAPTYGSPGVGSPGVGSPDRRLTRTSSTKTVHEDGEQIKSEDQRRRVGGGADDEEGHAEAAPVREGSVAKSQNRRLPNGSETVADDAQGFSPNDSDSITSGTTRARTARAPIERIAS